MTDKPYDPAKVVITIGGKQATDFTKPITFTKHGELTDKTVNLKNCKLTIFGHEVEVSDLPIQISGDVLITDAQRYRWLLQHVTEVLCEGKVTECYSKYMLPRLTCEDSSGRRYTFDEIIDIQMKRGEKND